MNGSQGVERGQSGVSVCVCVCGSRARETGVLACDASPSLLPSPFCSPSLCSSLSRTAHQTGPHRHAPPASPKAAHSKAPAALTHINTKRKPNASNTDTPPPAPLSLWRARRTRARDPRKGTDRGTEAPARASARIPKALERPIPSLARGGERETVVPPHPPSSSSSSPRHDVEPRRGPVRLQLRRG